MKKLLLTTSEFTNQNNEVKKKRVNVGRVHVYSEGGEAIVLDAAMCAVIGAMGQKAMNAGEDSVWLSIFEEDKQQAPMQQQPQTPPPYNGNTGQPQQFQQPPMQQQAPQPNGYNNNGSVNF